MFSAPEKNIEQLNLQQGQIVADFGAGSGAYTLAAAKALKGTGKVYAVDVQKDLLTRLQNTCMAEHLGNVAFIWGDLEKLGGTKLHENSCDVVIISNVLFQAPEKDIIIDEAKRVLKPGGSIAIIDWTGSFNQMGPTKEQVFPEGEARMLAEKTGFVFDRTLNAGNYHYGLVFRKGRTGATQAVTPRN
ncbi:MAG: methyltransferase domain-containing protein [bacterium]|nr:methyltransferase domain-containing protein [bacterium]